MRCVIAMALALCAASAASAALAQTEQRQRWDAAQRRGQAEDQQRGYQAMTLEDFALDGKDLATHEAKVLLGGSYISAGGNEFMFDGKVWVGLLTDDAPREARAILLRCRGHPMNPAYGHTGCISVVLAGHAVACRSIDPAGGRGNACLVVEGAHPPTE
jgi:hypothetical protein